jgi:hypothetical protein
MRFSCKKALETADDPKVAPLRGKGCLQGFM